MFKRETQIEKEEYPNLKRGKKKEERKTINMTDERTMLKRISPQN